jgi:nicotinamidase/pyrazinamidase
MTRVDEILSKGTDPEIDSYSAFFDNGHRQATGLETYLHDRGVDRVFILGLATDYCVKYTALDAQRLGFETWVVEDGCRGVELKPGDVDAAIQEMRDAGVRMVRSEELLRS